MGFRFRKSIGFKGFRLNFSKSGIGYSYGIPGFRRTKMANGRQRQTISIPGTGLSYVKDIGDNKGKKQKKEESAIDKIFDDRKPGFVSNEEIMEYLKTTKFITKENLVAKFNLTIESAQNILNNLKEKGILETSDNIMYKLVNKVEDKKRKAEIKEDDSLYEDVLHFAIKRGSISASIIQRYYKVSYKRASKIIDMLEENGIIGPQVGSKPREVLVGDENEIYY